MTDPVVPQKSPYIVEVNAGRKYFWCACGRSKNQPFCDGAHKGTDFTPLQYEATADKKLFFCGCKHTKSQPLCDGAHNRL